MQDEFSVFWYDPDGYCHGERYRVGAKEAVECAHSLTNRPATRMGIIRKVVIADGDDFTVFLWEHDKGVVFPQLGVVGATP